MSALLLKDIAQPGEQWLPIRGQKHLFVSNLGRAISFDYCGRGLTKIFAGWAVVVPMRKRSAVSLSILVCRAFNGPIPHGYEVNHLDGNRANNSASNLQATTRLDNIRHSLRTGLKGRNVASSRDRCLRLMNDSGIDVGAVLAHDAIVLAEQPASHEGALRYDRTDR